MPAGFASHRMRTEPPERVATVLHWLSKAAGCVAMRACATCWKRARARWSMLLAMVPTGVLPRRWG